MTEPTVLVGLDDSPAAHAAHQWAAHYARATGARLRAVHVLKWPVGLTPHAVKAGIRLHVPAYQVAEPYWRGLNRVFEDVATPEGSTLQFAQGDVADVLVRLSAQASLLVIGTRQSVGAGRYLTGAIARHCIGNARCPVVTVPAPLASSLHDHRDDRYSGTESALPVR